ncbi:MAG: carboxypeptidase regulatory-like domain-containing protein [Vicinamibacteria bacterium]
MPRLALVALLPSLLASAATAAELRGRLLLEEKPAAGFAVAAVPYAGPFEEARREARREIQPAALASVTTGPDGIFSLRLPKGALAPGASFRLRIEGRGAVPAETAALFGDDDVSDLGDLALARSGALAGRVVSADGAPVAGAELWLQSSPQAGFGDGDLLARPRVALSGADGAFRFDDAARAGNNLRVEARGFATQELRPREGALPRPIVLAPGFAISGTLRLPDGKRPASGALVRFEGAATTRWVEARADGGFRLSDLPKGTGKLVADGGERGRAELPSVKLPHEGARPTLVLAPSGAIEGRVVDARSGAALAGVAISVRQGQAARATRSGSDGRYRVAGLAPGSYRVEAEDPRYVAYVKNGVSPRAGEAAKADLPLQPAAGLSGQVVDEDGAPIAGARGQLALSGETGFAAFARAARGGERYAFRSGADGRFSARRLAPGENQRLTVTHSDYEPRTLGGLALEPGKTKGGVTVVLSRGIVLAGVVKDPDGAPVPGAEISLQQTRSFRGGRGGNVTTLATFVGGPDQRPRITTGADGRFEIRGLAAGDYSLVAVKQGYATASLDPVKAAADAPPVELVMAQGVAISGRIADSSGTPAEGYFVQARRRGGAQPGFGAGGLRDPTGADGAFYVDGLVAGEAYDLQIVGPGLGGPGPRREGIVAPADGVELVVPAKGRISGRVVDAQSGGPVTDFDVSAVPDRGGSGGVRIMMGIGGPGGGRNSLRATVRSDDGAFVLEDVAPGTWVVNVEAKGYQAARAAGIVVAEGKSVEGVQVRAIRGTLLRGRVLDARSGRGVPDVAVQAQPAGGGPGAVVMMDPFRGGGIATDADGAFEIEGLSAGKYVLTTQHPEYPEASLAVELAAGTTPAEIRLVPGGALGGSVLSETRQPLAGAGVSLVPAGEAGFRGGPFEESKATVTDEAGRFRFDHLGAGRYRVAATLRDRSSAPAELVLQASETRDDVVLTLAAGATIRGSVSGLSEAERGGVNVFASGPESYFGSARTAADGSFELGGAPVGTISLTATAGDFFSGARRNAKAEVAIVAEQAEAQVEIVFEQGFSISGSVTRSGEPLADVFVNASARGGGPSASARTDAQGAYRVQGLQAGEYVVSASMINGGSSVQQTVKVEGDRTLDLVIPVARLAGTVLDAATKQPLEDVVIDLGLEDSSNAAAMFFRRSASTDSSGRFAFEGLEARSYAVTARRSGYQFEKRQLAAREESEDVTIELRRGDGIGLVARDGLYGVPLRGLWVRALDASGASVFMGDVPLDSEGRGEVPSLKPGRYSLVVNSSNYATVTLPGVDAPASAVALALTPGGALEIRLGSQTLPAGGSATLRLLNASGQTHLLSPFWPDGALVVTSAQRRIAAVAPGRYRLVVEGQNLAKEVVVTEGGETLVELP